VVLFPPGQADVAIFATGRVRNRAGFDAKHDGFLVGTPTIERLVDRGTVARSGKDRVLKADIKLVPGPRSSSRNYDATDKMKVGRVRIASTRIFLRIYCVRQGAKSAVE
jgi:hypothetical protein